MKVTTSKDELDDAGIAIGDVTSDEDTSRSPATASCNDDDRVDDLANVEYDSPEIVNVTEVVSRNESVGISVGDTVGIMLGACDGNTLGDTVGTIDGDAEGTADGLTLGITVGDTDGDAVGTAVGLNVDVTTPTTLSPDKSPV